MRIAATTLALAAVGLSAASALAGPPPSIRTISYGGAITFTAKSPVSFPVQKADVFSRPCRITQFAGVGSPAIGADGTFTFRAGPTLNTRYRILVADREVLNVDVLVKPVVTIRRVDATRFHVEVTTGNGAGLDRKTILLQQRSGKAWRRVGSVKLKLTSRPDQIDAVASGDGKAALRGSGAVRAFLPAAQAKPCFTASASGATS